MATCQDGGNGRKPRRIENKERRTQLDALRDVIHGLKEARVDAEKLNDELLLYLIRHGHAIREGYAYRSTG